MEEIKMVLNYVKILIGQNFKEKIVTENDIGIITPFSEQKRQIDYILEKEMYKEIDVGTVEFFQGQEKNIIILSSVRSEIFFHDNQSHIGFLSNPKRLNVALTRAKSLLIIVGNPIPLMMEKHWCYLLDFCKRNNACRGINFNIQTDLNNEI
jgi:helicase MOV-10